MILDRIALKNLPSTPWKALSFDLAVWLLVSTVYWLNNVDLSVSRWWFVFGLALGTITFIPELLMVLMNDKCQEKQIKLLYSTRWILGLVFFNGLLMVGLIWLTNFNFSTVIEPLQPLGL
jgi:hypothetical protein